MDLTKSTPGFIGLIEEIKAAKKKDGWLVWITSRTGPNGRDQHRFMVAHDDLGQWVTDMFKAEADK